MATKDQSSNLPVVFNFGNLSIRTIDRDGEIWFVANDVCTALDIASPRNAVSRLDEDERDGVRLTDAMGREQEANIISESGLYSLVMGSRKAEAKQFKRWVTHDVLPSIRKTGSYTAPQAEAHSARDVHFDPENGAALRSVLTELVPDELLPGALAAIRSRMPELGGPQTREEVLEDALNYGRWFLSAHDGRLFLKPVPEDAFLVRADDMAQKIREPMMVPLRCLPDIITAAATRLSYVHKK